MSNYKLVDKIISKYHDLVPYDYRPREVWYKLKCFLFKRYTTVKSRHLGHTWCDKVELIPYTLFEMLETFVEKECSPGHVVWYGEDGHKILVGMEYKYVRDEMNDLLKWWNEEYIPYTKGENIEYLEIYNSFEQIDFDDLFTETDDLFRYDPAANVGEDKYLEYKNGYNKLIEFDLKMDSKLDEMCHRILNIRKFLWT